LTLHRALLGEEVDPPDAWVIGQVCEAFHCVPSVAERELDQHAELVFDVMDLRAYAVTFQRVKTMGKRPKDEQREMLRDPLVQAVLANEREAAGVPRREADDRDRRGEPPGGSVAP